MRGVLAFALLLVLAACEPTAPPDHVDLPTLASLPTETDTPPPTATAVADLNATQLFNLGLTQTSQAGTVTQRAVMVLTNDEAVQSTFTTEAQAALTADAQATTDAQATATADAGRTPSATPTATFTPDLSATPTSTPSITVTPSLTITDTPTRTPSITPSPTLNMDRPLFALAIMALSSTPPPPVTFVFPTATGFVPPGNTGGVICLPPQGGFGSAFAADTTLAAQIGCSLGSPLPYPAAVQTFERGTMIYLGTAPASIYVLYNTGTYTRFPDTFIDGVDPVSGGEIPPAGLFEPVRGFGKIWRSDPAVRNGLGWATQPESGTTGTLLQFQTGQMIALPPLNQIAVLTTFGTYRLIPGAA